MEGIYSFINSKFIEANVTTTFFFSPHPPLWLNALVIAQFFPTLGSGKYKLIIKSWTIVF